MKNTGMNNSQPNIPETAPEAVKNDLLRRKACGTSRPCKCKGRATKAILGQAENTMLPSPQTER